MIRCLITAGPTREYFDPVRFMSNPSSGKMGYALAEAATNRGWSVDLVSGPVSLQVPDGVSAYTVESGEEMLEQVQVLFEFADILIMAAAVMDYRPVAYSSLKIKKATSEITVTLEPVDDILKSVAARKGNRLVVGFAAETDNLESNARLKLKSKNLDYIVANPVGMRGAGFGADTNHVVVFSAIGGEESIGPAAKSIIAETLLDRFAGALSPA